MKSLLLIRHAKSSWDFDVDDFNRPLNHRGKTDAPALAKRLLRKEVAIDTFVSSPAKRAFTTATLFADVFGKKQEKIIIVPALYEPTPEAFLNTITQFDKEYQTVAVFSHNPGITDFANKLTTTKIDDMPTCAVFAIKAEVKNWKDFLAAEKSFWFFDYPKA